MALKRLDEEFDLKPGTQLLPYMKRLLPSLEGRFQDIESQQDIVHELTEEIRAAALMRMNEILIPATADIIAVTKLGFLLAPVSTSYKLVLGYMAMFVDEGPQRASFTPSPYLIIEHTSDDYGIARLIGYHKEDGLLEVSVTAIHGNAGPWADWMVSSTPGMADSTKLYHDAIAPMYAEVTSDHNEVVILHGEILAAAQALEESGLDTYAFVRRDGTVPFQAVQVGVAPSAGSNDTALVTSAWVRARIQEYAPSGPVLLSGSTMTGYLTLSGNPVNVLHAATKQYVDGAIGSPHWVNDYLGIRGSSPVLYLQSLASAQNRFIEARSPGGVVRWQMFIGNTASESGGNAGSDFALVRYSDAGLLLGTVMSADRATGGVAVHNTLWVGSTTVPARIAMVSASSTMSVYSDGGVVGFLGTGGGWASYFMTDGSMWSPRYGWLHDYVGNLNVAEDQVVSGGASVVIKELGYTLNVRITIDPGDRPIQRIINNGWGEIAPAGISGQCTVHITNVGGAALPSFVNWTKVDGSLDAIVGSQFVCSIIQMPGHAHVISILKVA